MIIPGPQGDVRDKDVFSYRLALQMVAVFFNLPISFRGFPNQLIRNPSKIEWDLTNGPLSKLVELLDTRV